MVVRRKLLTGQKVDRILRLEISLKPCFKNLRHKIFVLVKDQKFLYSITVASQISTTPLGILLHQLAKGYNFFLEKSFDERSFVKRSLNIQLRFAKDRLSVGLLVKKL